MVQGPVFRESWGWRDALPTLPIASVMMAIVLVLGSGNLTVRAELYSQETIRAEMQRFYRAYLDRELDDGELDRVVEEYVA